jgi:hypothetical protein
MITISKSTGNNIHIGKLGSNTKISDNEEELEDDFVLQVPGDRMIIIMLNPRYHLQNLYSNVI